MPWGIHDSNVPANAQSNVPANAEVPHFSARDIQENPYHRREARVFRFGTVRVNELTPAATWRRLTAGLE